MSDENIVQASNTDNQQNAVFMNEQEWKGFVEGAALSFLIRYNLQQITVDDGCGKKGKIKVNKDGEYVVDSTVRSMM